MHLPISRGLPRARSFEKFDTANPGFYDLLVTFARQAKASGKARYSITPIVARARWAYDIETNRGHDDDFKINDHVSPFYARLIMFREADLDGFFDTRTSPDPQPEVWIGRLRELHCEQTGRHVDEPGHICPRGSWL